MTETDLDQQATDAEDWLDSLDPATAPSRDGRHLRAIGAALTALEQAQANLDQAVAQAHAAGDSWGAIGMVLGTSKQNAHRKFAHVQVAEPLWVQAEMQAVGLLGYDGPSVVLSAAQREAIFANVPLCESERAEQVDAQQQRSDSPA